MQRSLAPDPLPSLPSPWIWGPMKRCYVWDSETLLQWLTVVKPRAAPPPSLQCFKFPFSSWLILRLGIKMFPFVRCRVESYVEPSHRSQYQLLDWSDQVIITVFTLLLHCWTVCFCICICLQVWRVVRRQEVVKVRTSNINHKLTENISYVLCSDWSVSQL